jgi:choline dehydrogenase
MNWDYVIVGAGSAGCALAHELVRSGEARVLILEAGGTDRSPFIRVPAGQIFAIRRHDWGYVSQADPTRNGRSETWERGRVLGGSSSINGMMYVRGAHHDYDRWAQSGHSGWASADVLPLFRDMEHSDQTGALRGNSGPLWVQTVKHVHPLTDAFVQSAVAAGWPFNSDYNDVTQEGVAYAQLSQRRGFRCSAAGAFLKPHLGARNIKLLLNATVRTIHVHEGRATGISFVRDRAVHEATARHVIVCAGAINSPQLLMASGIGDPEELRLHGITPVVTSPNVGRNLREHPLLKMTYKVRIPSNNLTEGIGQKLRIAFQYLVRRTGPVANLFEAAAFLKSRQDLPAPDIQLHFLTVGYTQSTGGKIRPLDYPAVTVLVNASYPRSTGRIRLGNARSGDAPSIECRLLDDPADLDTLLRGVEVVRGIMATAPMRHLVECEVAPGNGITSRPSLEDYIRRHTEIAYHPSGTCRMGTDAGAVVTPDLRVNGVENLWVADASVMPDLISGNTNAVCMMIGLKLGRHLRTKVDR